MKVDPRGTSQEGDQSLDRDYRASWNILQRGLVGLGRPELTPVEMGPLLGVPARAVVAGQALAEAGSPLRKLGVVHVQIWPELRENSIY